MLSLKKVVTSVSNKIPSITYLFTILAVFVGILLLSYDVHYFLSFRDSWGDYFNNIIVEAHGLLFDLVVLGILISIYERRRQKKEAIEREMNLINDYRNWKEKEATYRIVGAIKRLNRLGAKKIDISDCFLKGAILSGVDLSGANLSRANLSGANLQNAILRRANIVQTDLIGAELDGADLTWGDIQDEHNYPFKFLEAKLTGATLISAKVDRNWLSDLEKFEVIGREEIQEKYRIDNFGRLQLK